MSWAVRPLPCRLQCARSPRPAVRSSACCRHSRPPPGPPTLSLAAGRVARLGSCRRPQHLAGIALCRWRVGAPTGACRRARCAQARPYSRRVSIGHSRRSWRDAGNSRRHGHDSGSRRARGGEKHCESGRQCHRNLDVRRSRRADRQRIDLLKEIVPGLSRFGSSSVG